MATYNRTDFIATCGNFEVKKGKEKLWTCDGAGNCSGPLNLFVGEPAVFNPRTGITYDIADLPSATYIAFGVGVGNSNHAGALATDIQYIFGSQQDQEACDLKMKATVKPPCCGIPQIVDVFFDCVVCDKQYSLEVLLDDSLVRSRYNQNERAKYIYTVGTSCCNCKDCDPETNCDEVACKLVDAINGKVQKDPTKITRFTKANLANQYQPFSASRLFLQDKEGNPETSHVFCLGLENTKCKKCAVLPAITGFQVDDVDYAFEYTTATEPVDGKLVTYPEQIKRVVCSINRILEDVGGSAKLQRGIGRCCPYSIEVNTCGVAPKLLVDGKPLDPKLSRNPFSTKQIEQICKGCGITPEKIKLGCGIRLFVDPIEVPCHCAYPPHLASPNMYVRNIEAQFVGEGWVCNNFHSFTSQKSERPEGFGYYWQDQAVHRQYKGGPGRNFRYSNNTRGKVVALPDESSNFTNAAKGIKCEETYCAYNLVIQKSKKGFFNNALTWTNCNIVYLLIPDSDDKTLPSIVSWLAAFQKIGICIPGNLICLKANPDVEADALTVGTEATVDVAANDPAFADLCDGDLVYTLGATTNATVVNNEDGTFAVTAKACGDWSFCYTVSCKDADGKITEISSSTGSGTAVEAE